MKKNNYDMESLKKKLLECQSQMSATLEIITPSVAMRYLALNIEDTENQIQNRAIDDKTLNKYMNDMMNDRWEVGEPILFDIQNHLIDGQYRLTGVVKTGIPIISWVIRGLSENAYRVIDCGKKRTIKDFLTMSMMKDLEGNSVKLSRAARVGTAIMIMHNMSKNSSHISKDRFLTPAEIVDTIKNDFDYYEEPFKNGSKSKISCWQKRIKYSIPASYFAAFYYTHKRTSGDAVDDFLDVLTSNDSTTPVIVRKLRDNVLENKNRSSFDKKYLDANSIIKRVEVLFTYYQENTLNRKKEFTKKDLE